MGDLIQLTELAAAVLGIREVDRYEPYVRVRRGLSRETDDIPVSEREQMIRNAAADQS
jgi:hypothetical protein